MTSAGALLRSLGCILLIVYVWITRRQGWEGWLLVGFFWLMLLADLADRRARRRGQL